MSQQQHAASLTDHSPSVCPSCGHSLKGDRVVERGDWFLMPGLIAYKGSPLRVNPTQATLLYKLALAHPRPVSAEALLIATSRDGYEVSSNVLPVQISRLRRSLRQMGVPSPVLTLTSASGYYTWSDKPVVPISHPKQSMRYTCIETSPAT